MAAKVSWNMFPLKQILSQIWNIFIMTLNKCFAYAAAPSVEVALNYQTNWITAQACQQWRLELTTHEKQFSCPGRPTRALWASHTINTPSYWWAVCLLHQNDVPRTVNPPSFPHSSWSVTAGRQLCCCFAVSLKSCTLTSFQSTRTQPGTAGNVWIPDVLQRYSSMRSSDHVKLNFYIWTAQRRFKCGNKASLLSLTWAYNTKICFNWICFKLKYNWWDIFSFLHLGSVNATEPKWSETDQIMVTSFGLV